MSIKIIIVDDHPMVRHGLQMFLSLDPEIEIVDFAQNGLEAVEKTRVIKPDVVIMDLNMPEMDGIEATSIIKQEQPAIRVIVWTGVFFDYSNTKAIAAGADFYLSKITDSNKLLQAIKG